MSNVGINKGCASNTAQNNTENMSDCSSAFPIIIFFKTSATFMGLFESFPLASIMPVCKHPVATLGLGGNRLPCAYAQKNVGSKEPTLVIIFGY